jgi:hypothetical protein
VWAGSCPPVARRIYVVYGLARIKGRKHSLTGAYMDALMIACNRGDLTHAQWLNAVFTRHNGTYHQPQHALNMVKPLFRACELGHFAFAQWYADSCKLTARHLSLHWDDSFGGEWVLDLLFSVGNRDLLNIMRWFVRRFDIQAHTLRQVWRELHRTPAFMDRTEVLDWLASAIH